MARRRQRRKNIRGEPRPIDGAIWALVRTYVPSDTLRLVLLREIWPTIAGRSLAAQAWPEAVRGREAVLAVHDSQWLHELTYMRQALLGKIRERAPQLGLESVRLRLARRERPPPPPVDPPAIFPERAPPLAAEPDPATAAAIHAVDDPALREAIAAARITLSRPPPPYPR